MNFLAQIAAVNARRSPALGPRSASSTSSRRPGDPTPKTGPAKAERSPATIQSCVDHEALQALRPASKTRGPVRTRPEWVTAVHQVATHRQRDAVLPVAERHSPHAHPLISVAVFLGLPKAESVALRAHAD